MSVSNAEAPRLSLFRLAGPTIVGNLLLSMVHLAAIKIVAELGAEAVAAVIAADRIYMAIQLIIFSITAGTTTMVAYAWGARNLEEADRVVKLSAAACLAASLSLWVIIQWLATPLVAIFGLQGPMLAEAAQYLKVLIYFNVFFSFLAVISAALRAAGDALTPGRWHILFAVDPAASVAKTRQTALLGNDQTAQVDSYRRAGGH